MNLNLDKSSPLPIKVQLREQIRMLINSGLYKYGHQLPSITAMASDLEINKNTIVAVLKELEAKGYIKCQRGKGAFVVWKYPNESINGDIVNKIDSVIREANRKNISLDEVLSLLSTRYAYARSHKTLKALFVMGINRELLELNIKKLKEKLSGVMLEGMLIGNDTISENISDSFDSADIIIIPSIIYEFYKHLIPEHKHIIKTIPELKDLNSLKKGIEKKSKVAVIGPSRNGAQIMSGVFVSERMFRPKVVLSMSEVEKYKKELKEMDSFVICMSARDVLEKIKLKDKNVFFFSDYICEDSINSIKMFLKKIN